MKITALETVRLDEFPNVLWVRVHTDEGLTGLGETFFGARAVEAYLHESAAMTVLGRDPLAIERIGRDLTPYIGFAGTGAETRGRSAVDIALWDLFGKATGQPVYQLLGGLSRGPDPHLQHLRGLPLRAQPSRLGHRRLGARRSGRRPLGGPRRLPPPGRRARAQPAGAGHHGDEESGRSTTPRWSPTATGSPPGISNRALEPFRKIRGAVGDRMDIMVELHSLWRHPAAGGSRPRSSPSTPFWYEDPVRMDSLAALTDYAAKDPGPHLRERDPRWQVGVPRPAGDRGLRQS